jgi:signal transduction histidine kinase
MKLAHAASNERLVTLGQVRSADMNERLGRPAEAFAFGRQGLRRLRQLEDVGNIPLIQVVLARAHLHTGRADSALMYGQTSLRASQRSGTKIVSRDASEVVAQANAQLGRFDDAYRYQLLSVAYKDSLSSQDLIRRTAALQYQYALDKQKSQIWLLTRNEQLIRQQNRQQQLLLIGSLAALAVVAGLSVLLWRNNRQKQQANKQLRQQQQELRATQAQLIQREKMASLGELTTGIAHEMQNPLNFVTNFAEVSTDLIAELRETRASHAGLENELLNDLTLNLHKITQYGQQAARIVRGMVEHARPNSGERQPTDLNALCEEYLRLAYHGLRAQDKQFMVETETDFAPLPLVNMVGAEVGRVLHNLLLNAFYAVRQRQQEEGSSGYQPKVRVSTRLRKGQAIIKVRDNGTGIPAQLQAKIFQPFFTTKPPGEGIGLGLSLSYTIITQGHGGALTVESVEGEFTEFTISLPAYATPSTTSYAQRQPEMWEEQHH